MPDKEILRDEIIEEVERVREEIARRYDFDVDRIFEAMIGRNAERQKERDLQASGEAAKDSA